MFRISIVVALSMVSASMASTALASDNVDVATTPKNRVNHMRELVTFAVDELDETATSDGMKERSSRLGVKMVADPVGVSFSLSQPRRKMGSTMP